MKSTDWYADALELNRELTSQFHRSRRSAEWSQDRHSSDNLESFFTRALQAARNVARHQGVPRHTEIRLARLNEVGAGAAGFKDGPDSFFHPYILLDRAAYDRCRSFEEALDVYCGIALHEAGHILHSRDAYRRLAQPERNRLLNCFDNLLEDDRIENLLCEESPGYAPYIVAARRLLLEQGSFGRSFIQWNSLPDLDKVLAIFVAFIRIPHKITEEAREWCAINGECVFQTLRSALNQRPLDEPSVASISEWLHDYYQQLKSHYSSDRVPQDDTATDSRASDDHRTDAVPDAAERLNRQWAADVQDALSSLELEITKQQAEATDANDAGEETGNDAPTERPAPAAPRSDRFSPLDLQAAIESQTKVTQAFSDETAEATERARLRTSIVTISEQTWEWDGRSRSVLVTRVDEPDVEARLRYQQSKDRVSDLISAMRSSLPRLGRVRHEVRRDRTTGSLDPRRIAFATVTDRIFKQMEVTERCGMTLGLLLDASGSMHDKADITRDTAVLLAAAFTGDPLITMGIYSHTSMPENSYDCHVQILYENSKQSLTALGTYEAVAQNYDHCAITKCDELLRKLSRQGDRRILIVLSDGNPVGEYYGGATAVEASRQSVAKARMQGTHVIGIGIGGHHCNEIYGDRWLLNITNCNELPNQLKRLMTRVLRGG